jgi:hypothetical protein
MEMSVAKSVCRAAVPTAPMPDGGAAAASAASPPVGTASCGTSADSTRGSSRPRRASMRELPMVLRQGARVDFDGSDFKKHLP